MYFDNSVFDIYSTIPFAQTLVFYDLDLKSTIKLIPKLKYTRTKVTILFSPSAASFDQYKNFEDRGKKFNMLIKRYLSIK